MNAGGLAERSLTLPAELNSAGAARRLLREVLVHAGRSEWLDAAELACTEVVSNAVLHAHTDLAVKITVREDAVRVDVHDSNPLLPILREYDTQATTGRGMALVAAVSSDHGICDIGPDGKTVWFEVGDHIAEASEDELLAAWDDDGWELDDLLDNPPIDVAAEQTRQVVLQALPATLWLAAREHHDALLRELVLYSAPGMAAWTSTSPPLTGPAARSPPPSGPPSPKGNRRGPHARPSPKGIPVRCRGCRRRST